MKITSRFIIPLALCLLVASPIVTAWAEGNDFVEEVDEGPAHGPFRDLRLSGPQRRKLREIRHSTQSEITAMRLKMQEKLDAFSEERSGEGNTEALRKSWEDIQALRLKLARARFERFAEVREILNGDQRKVMERLIKTRNERSDKVQPKGN